MGKLKFDKKIKTETDNSTGFKLFFSGGESGLKYELKISGDADCIGDFTREHRIEHFGQQFDFDFANNQKGFDEYGDQNDSE